METNVVYCTNSSNIATCLASKDLKIVRNYSPWIKAAWELLTFWYRTSAENTWLWTPSWIWLSVKRIYFARFVAICPISFGFYWSLNSLLSLWCPRIFFGFKKKNTHVVLHTGNVNMSSRRKSRKPLGLGQRLVMVEMSTGNRIAVTVSRKIPSKQLKRKRWEIRHQVLAVFRKVTMAQDKLRFSWTFTLDADLWRTSQMQRWEAGVQWWAS